MNCTKAILAASLLLFLASAQATYVLSDWANTNTKIVSTETADLQTPSDRSSSIFVTDTIFVVWENQDIFAEADSSNYQDIFFKAIPLTALDNTGQNFEDSNTHVVSRGDSTSGDRSQDPWIYANNDNVFVVWADRSNIFNSSGSGYDILFKYMATSDIDFNGTWADRNFHIVSSTDSGGTDSIFPRIIGNTDNLFVVWGDELSFAEGSDSDYDVFFKYLPLSDLDFNNA